MPFVLEIDYQVTIALAIASWMIAEAATPIQMIKYWLHLDNAMTENSFMNFFRELLNCSLCVGTWVGFFYAFDWQQALFVAVLAESISRLSNNS